MPITQTDLARWFTYHPPTGDQPKLYENLRAAALMFAQEIIATTPECPDQTVAIRCVREAVMWANAAIACQPKWG